VLPATAGKLNAILPLAKMTGTGKHIILYQEPAGTNRFRLTAANRRLLASFYGTSAVAEISGATRGALFPCGAAARQQARHLSTRTAPNRR
jgi:hypothetical protein